MKKEIEQEKAEALANKIKWKQREVICPVCREAISEKLLCDLDNLDKCPPIVESAGPQESIVISEKMRRIQIEMKNLFEKQKQAGGIIDLNVKDEIIVLTVRGN